MQGEDIKQQKKNLISGILLNEEDTLRNLSEIVEMSKEHFQIEPDTSDIIFKDKVGKPISQKILLLLIGRYLLVQGDLLDSAMLNINEISRHLGVIKTSLSKSLGALVFDNKIKKDAAGNYWAVHYNIKKALEDMNNG